MKTHRHPGYLLLSEAMTAWAETQSGKASLYRKERREEVAAKIRQFLCDGKLRAFLLDKHDGHFVEIERHVWNKQDADPVFYSYIDGKPHDHMSFTLTGPPRRSLAGTVQIHDDDWKSFLEGKPPEMVAVSAVSQRDFVPPYTTPFLEIMQRAIREKEITKEEQPKVDDLADWFSRQTLSDGRGISARQARAMATFVRLPERMKGGSHPQRKSKPKG